MSDQLLTTPEDLPESDESDAPAPALPAQTSAGPAPRSLGDRARSAMLWDFLGLGGLAVLTVLTSSVEQHMLRINGAPASTADTYMTQFLVLVSTATLLAQLMELGFEQGLARFIPEYRLNGQEGVLPRVVRRIVVFRLALFAVVAGGIWLLRGDFAQIVTTKAVEQQAIVSYTPLLLALLFVYLFQDLGTTLLVTSYQQKHLNSVRVLVNVLNLLLAVGFILAGWQVTGVLWAGIIAGVTWLVLLGWRGWRTVLRPAIGKPGPGRLPIRKLGAYTGTMFIYNIMAFALGKNLDILLINREMSSQTSAGTNYSIGYGLAYQTLLLTVLIFAGGFILPLVSELYQTENFDGLRRVYRGMIEFIYMLALPVAAAGAVLAPQVIFILYDKEPAQTSYVASAYFISMGILRIGGAPATFLAGMDRERWLIVSRVSGGILNMVGDIVLIFPFGVMGPVYATTAAQLLTLGFEGYMVHRAIHPRYPWGFLLKMLVISLGIAGASYLVADVALAPLLGPVTGAIASTGLHATAASKAGVLAELAAAGVAAGLVFLVGLVLTKPISPENMDMFWRLRIPAKQFLARLLGIPPQIGA